jgi:3-phosphoshikimate 1-carboxyvinyltransferase
MNLHVTPGYSLRGEVTLPGDKSLSHRAALFAAMADGESRVENFLFAGVTKTMLDALSALGVSWELEQGTLVVRGRGLLGLQEPSRSLDCGNSATTLRLLAGALAAAGIPAVLDGAPGLQRRPMRRIIEPLLQMGVSIESADNCTPIRLRKSPTPLRGITYTLPIASAQVKSCLLLAGLAAENPTVLFEPGPSRDHTERMLSSMGISLQTGQISQGPKLLYQTVLYPPQPFSLNPLEITLPGDISSAAFLIVGALITRGSELVLKNVGLNPTRTGLVDALLEMGADIRVTEKKQQAGEPVGDLIVRFSALRGVRIAGSLVVRMIDEFPIFAIAACFAKGVTVVSQAEELRHKESDRISALCGELKNLGVYVEETVDGFLIQGGNGIAGGSVNAQQDHRLAMALVVAGLAARESVTVEGAEVISESYPEFLLTLQSIGGQVVRGVD